MWVVSQAPGVVDVLETRALVATEAEGIRLAVELSQAVVMERS